MGNLRKNQWKIKRKKKRGSVAVTRRNGLNEEKKLKHLHCDVYYKFYNKYKLKRKYNGMVWGDTAIVLSGMCKVRISILF